MAMARWGMAFQSTKWKVVVGGRPTATCGTNLNNRLRYRPFFASADLQSPQDPENENNDKISANSLREKLLHESLKKIHLDPALLSEANSKNMKDPTTGYDAAFGRPAIRAYRSFLQSSKIISSDKTTLGALADGCARQIDFLRRRHLAHQTDWVRHTDSPDKLLQDNENNPPSRFPLILILDNIRSAFNVGSLFRTADACGVQEVITTGITAHPGGGGAEKLNKSALGAENVVTHRHFVSTRDALITLKQELPDWSLIGLETTENSVEYTQVEYPSQCILILGNEVTGIDPEVLVELDYVCQIPMFGAKNSLNVAACAPVVLYEIIRQWGMSSTNQGDV